MEIFTKKFVTNKLKEKTLLFIFSGNYFKSSYLRIYVKRNFHCYVLNTLYKKM